MGALRDGQLCPKRDRCKHGAECVDTDVFRGECLCFESKKVNMYEHDRKWQREYAARKRKERLNHKGGRKR